MKLNLKVSETEKKAILESHFNLKKVLFESKRKVLLMEDDNSDLAFLQEASKICNFPQRDPNRQIKKGAKSKKYGLYLTDPNTNSQWILYADISPVGDGKRRKAVEKKVNGTIVERTWYCDTKQEIAGCEQTIAQGGWLTTSDPGFNQINFTDPKNYTTMVCRGVMYFKDNLTRGAQAAVSKYDKEVVEYIKGEYGDQYNKTTNPQGLWNFEEPFYSSGWQQIQPPGMKERFRTEVTIWVDPVKFKTLSTKRQQGSEQTIRNYTVEDCVGIAGTYFDLYAVADDVPFGANASAQKQELRRCRQKFCGTSGRLCAETQKKGFLNLKGRLGSSFGEIIDFFSGMNYLKKDGVEYSILNPNSPWNLDKKNV